MWFFLLVVPTEGGTSGSSDAFLVLLVVQSVGALLFLGSMRLLSLFQRFFFFFWNSLCL